MIDIALLGGVSVSVEGNQLSGEAAQRRRVALLTLLAAPALRPVSRDRLIGWLWPDHDPESARHLLSAALHVLRKSLGADALVTTGDDVALNPALVHVDAVAFREAVAAGDLERALSLYGGEFMDGFFVNDAADFSQWVDGERDELKRLYGETLERAAAVRAQAGHAAGAAEAWRRRAALDPYDARVALELMRALAAAGQRPAAIQHARLHAQLLEQEFGAEPDREVAALAEELRQAPAEAIRVAATAPAPPKTEQSAPAAGPGPVAAADATAPLPSAVPVLPASRAAGPRRISRLWWAVGGTAAVALAAALLAYISQPLVIGVRPFTSREPVLDSIGYALAEDVATECGRLNRVRLVATDQAFATANVADPRAAIRRMRADVVLDGTLDSQDGLVNVHLEVTRKNGRDAVTEKVSSPVAGPELTHAILDKLASRLGREVRAESAVPAGDDYISSEADQYFLQGRNAWLRRASATPQSLRDALQDLRKATELAPGYARAWAALANTYNMLGSYDYAGMAPESAYVRADSAARLALKYLPRFWEARAALANAQANYRWDWKSAESNYSQALEEPGVQTWVKEWYALLLAALGRHREARARTLEAVREQPNVPLTLLNRAHVLYYAGDFASANQAVEQALALDPGHGRALIMRAAIDLASDHQEAALQTLSAVDAASPEPEPIVIALLGYAQARIGHQSEARAQLQRLANLARDRYVPHELIALVHVALGDNNAAFEELNRALAERSSGMMYLEVEPLIEPLRSDRRYEQLIRAVGL